MEERKKRRDGGHGTLFMGGLLKGGCRCCFLVDIHLRLWLPLVLTRWPCNQMRRKAREELVLCAHKEQL